MSIQHALSIRNDIADLVASNFDAGSYFWFLTADDEGIVQLFFDDPAFVGSAANGEIAAGPITSGESVIAGIIAKAKFYDSSDVEKLVCSVTLEDEGGDIELNVVDVTTPGTPVQVTSLTYVAPE